MMGALELESRYRALLDAVACSGVLLKRRQQSIVSSNSFITKADNSIVTTADLESQTLLVDALVQFAPSPFSIISEEEGEFARPTEGSLWFLDPLDGTAHYAKGRLDYAILLSEWRDRRPVFSVVHYPATGELGWAHEAMIGFESSVVTGTPSVLTQLCYISDENLRSDVQRRTGGACVQDATESTRALFDLAAGKLSGAVIQVCGHGAWDLAASTHLVLASGGFVCDESGAALDMNDPTVTCKFVVAARDRAMGLLLLGALNGKSYAG
ncbi:inositol monophosphatase family protein [Rhodopseudomonas palustris]|uniref:Inositol monophosphatase n=1 Tax=Rhodopseudomonas palustris (strain BisB18) TaxID=316056 RepID=Q21D25_RHOPB